MDVETLKATYQSLTLDELKDLLRKVKLPVTGLKGDLIDRLIESQIAFASIAPTETSPETIQTESKPVNKAASFDTVQLLLNAIRLPQTQLITFTGDPLQYYSFIKSFQNCVGEVQGLDSNTKLLRLLQSCEGPAKKLVESCMVMAPDDGYPRALTLLKKHFGDSYIITEAWLGKILKGPLISNKSGLRTYALDMRTCYETLSAMQCLRELSSQRCLLSIAKRLPRHLQTKWLREVQGIRQTRGLPTFEDLVCFVETGSDEANDPVFGELSSLGNQSEQHNRVSVPATPKLKNMSFVTDTSTEETYDPQSVRSCGMCKGNHFISACETFRDQSPDARMSHVKRSNLCFNCLAGSHMVNGCLVKGRCTVCSRRHHTLIHEAIASSRNFKPVTRNVEEPKQEHSSYCQQGVSSKVCMKVLPVRVNDQVNTYAVIDSASTISLCDEDLANELNLKGFREEIRMNTVTQEGSVMTGYKVHLQIQSLDGGCEINVSALTVPKIPVQSSAIPDKQMIQSWPHLAGVPLHELNVSKVGLLIGADTPEAFWTSEERRGKKKEPYAIKTTLGWCVLGPSQSTNQLQLNQPVEVNAINDDQDKETKEERVGKSDQMDRHETTSKLIEDFLKGEFPENLADDQSSASQDDRRALEMMNRSVHLVDGHYQLRLPWRSNPPNMPSRKGLAFKRLSCLKSRLSKDTVLNSKYRSTMTEYIREGYARKITKEERNKDQEPVWYLPHHPVVQVTKDKTRIVFDCAARYGGFSLNDYLLPGPNLNNNMVGVLLRFREEQIALSADIRAMFHQVKVHPDDVHALRFLWWSERTERKIGWDNPIDEELTKEWMDWKDQLLKLTGIQIPRCYKNYKLGDACLMELHIFCDASEKAYGAVSYMRCVYPKELINTSFIMAKSRVAPSKAITIPRLELSAAVLSVRMNSLIRRELELGEDVTSFYWTDSVGVLKCIQATSKRFQTSVANRLSVIHDGSDVSQWYFVKGVDNPADMVSRGMSGIKFMEYQENWFRGPDFLRHKQSQWPKINTVVFEEPISDLISLRISLAWLNRFILFLKWRHGKGSEPLVSELTIKELRLAENRRVLRMVQEETLSVDLKNLENQSLQFSKKSKIYKLCPIIKDNLICVGGRLRNLKAHHLRHPIILPEKHHVTELIIRQWHGHLGHVGAEHTLSQVRRSYWIVNGRKSVRRVLGKCVKCIRLRGSAVCQRMADLPSDRVEPDHRPFSTCGVDLFGPMIVKQGRAQASIFFKLNFFKIYVGLWQVGGRVNQALSSSLKILVGDILTNLGFIVVFAIGFILAIVNHHHCRECCIDLEMTSNSYIRLLSHIRSNVANTGRSNSTVYFRAFTTHGHRSRLEFSRQLLSCHYDTFRLTFRDAIYYFSFILERYY
ncbi:hypothetical protein GQR58_016564 [Nymphon striatum]|nr:hypothetical protein GQR58_016564 [Nymphon striatum]